MNIRIKSLKILIWTGKLRATRHQSSSCSIEGSPLFYIPSKSWMLHRIITPKTTLSSSQWWWINNIDRTQESYLLITLTKITHSLLLTLDHSQIHKAHPVSAILFHSNQHSKIKEMFNWRKISQHRSSI